MTTPNPLSNDWLYWDPETIHSYPNNPDSIELAGLKVVPEEISLPRSPTNTEARVLIRELLRDVAAGVVSGLVAAVLLAALIAFFPSTTRADMRNPDATWTQTIYGWTRAEVPLGTKRSGRALDGRVRSV